MYLTSVPLLEKINFHMLVGEILYYELSQNAMIISKVEKLRQKVATNLK